VTWGTLFSINKFPGILLILSTQKIPFQTSKSF
jgi:hypothetical protein